MSKPASLAISEHLLHRRPLSALLLDLRPLDARLHCRKLGNRHILDVLAPCHVPLPSSKIVTSGNINCVGLQMIAIEF